MNWRCCILCCRCWSRWLACCRLIWDLTNEIKQDLVTCIRSQATCTKNCFKCEIGLLVCNRSSILRPVICLGMLSLGLLSLGLLNLGLLRLGLLVYTRIHSVRSLLLWLRATWNRSSLLLDILLIMTAWTLPTIVALLFTLSALIIH